MCYGEVISARIQRSRGERTCGDCGKTEAKEAAHGHGWRRFRALLRDGIRKLRADFA